MNSNKDAPLEGSIPDMTSSTEHHVSLQKIYQEKAEADCQVMEQLVRKSLKRIGRDPGSISKATIKSFCQNARKINVCRYRSIEEESMSPLLPELHKYFLNEEYSAAINFYILLRAVDRFTSNYNRFPGLFEDELTEEMSRLKTVAVSIFNEMGANGSTLSDDLTNEMCRFGGAELHAVAAFIGGVASQEAIKFVLFRKR